MMHYNFYGSPHAYVGCIMFLNMTAHFCLIFRQKSLYLYVVLSMLNGCSRKQ